MVKNTIVAIFAGLIMICLAYTSNFFFLSDEVTTAQIAFPALKKMEPAGEIITGLPLEQIIILPKSLFEVLNRSNNLGKVYITFFLASYGRINTSKYSLYLKQGSNTVKRIIDAREVKDNYYLRVSFSAEEFRLFLPGEALLGIESMDGQPGNAITAWLTKDIRHGYTVASGNSTIPVFDIVLVNRPELRNNIPLGELLPGHQVQQVITITDSMAKSVHTDTTDKKYCISLLMATYSRVNSCNLIVSVTQKGSRIEKTITVDSIKDNSLVPIVFTVKEWSKIEAGSALLSVKSTDASPGNAVTLWLTEDNHLGNIIIDGREMKTHSMIYSIGKFSNNKRSLVFSIATESKIRSVFIVRNLFVLLYALFAFVIVFAWVSQKTKTIKEPRL